MDDGEVKDAYSRESIRYFLDQVVIASHPEPRRFGLVAEPWQKELIDPKASAFDGLAGITEYRGPLSFLSVLARGHDKSSLEGRLLAWSLCYSRKPIEAYLAAADKDQAKIILASMEKEARLNPWYGSQLKFNRNEIIGPAGVCKVLASDAGSAYGLQGNLYICDEITHWGEGRGRQMWDALWSGRAKVPGSLFVVITNAGILDSWQDTQVRRVAYENPLDWRVFEREGNLASWMTESAREQVRRSLPELAASRLLDNKWINAAEASGYLLPADVRACEDPLAPAFRGSRNPRYQYVAAVDYGRVKDRTVMVLLHQDESNRTVIDDLTVLAPAPGRPIDVTHVDTWVNEVWQSHKPKKIIFDPYQMESTIQRCERSGMPVERWNTRSGGGNMDLAMHLRSIITNRRVAWNPRYLGLSSELINLITKVTGYGFRFDHKSGQHDDQAVTLAMAAIHAIHYPAYPVPNNLPVKLDKPMKPENPLHMGYGVA